MVEKIWFFVYDNTHISLLEFIMKIVLILTLLISSNLIAVVPILELTSPDGKKKTYTLDSKKFKIPLKSKKWSCIATTEIIQKKKNKMYRATLSCGSDNGAGFGIEKACSDYPSRKHKLLTEYPILFHLVDSVEINKETLMYHFVLNCKP